MPAEPKAIRPGTTSPTTISGPTVSHSSYRLTPRRPGPILFVWLACIQAAITKTVQRVVGTIAGEITMNILRILGVCLVFASTGALADLTKSPADIPSGSYTL